MRYVFITIFCLSFINASSQKSAYSNLRLIYPESITYDTILVTDFQGNILSESEVSRSDGRKVKSYSIKKNSNDESAFSIYFGGSKSFANDKLYFEGRGDSLFVEVEKTFSLRKNIDLKLRNVFNFEELHSRYLKFLNSKMQDYDSLAENDKSFNISRRKYTLQTGFDFVKQNLNNPYSIELFSVFIIAPRTYTTYDEALDFYTKYLKQAIQNERAKSFVENKINMLAVSLVEGNKAPAFSAHTVDHQLINNEIFSGKNVLLIFWATWCGPCMQELPYLKKIHEKYKDDNLKMISVSLDHDSSKMSSMIHNKKMNWLHIFNNQTMLNAFAINAIPAMFLINEDGIIIYNSISRETGTDIADLNAVLKKQFKH